MPELTRLAVLVGVILAVWVWLQLRERRTFSSTGLAPGITVVTSPACIICPETIASLDALGARPIVIDASVADVSSLDIQAAPTVIVADATGREVMRRSGRSTVSDVELIVATSSELVALG